MIKKYLLKLAYLINKHYKTIEIKHEDYIRFGDCCFVIVETTLSKEIGCIDELSIKAHSREYYLDSLKISK